MKPKGRTCEALDPIGPQTGVDYGVDYSSDDDAALILMDEPCGRPAVAFIEQNGQTVYLCADHYDRHDQGPGVYFEVL